MMLDNLEKFVRKCRESGLLYTVTFAFSSIVPETLMGFGAFVVMTKTLAAGGSHTESERFRWIGKEDSGILERAGYKAQHLHSRFLDGAVAAILETADRVAVCGWYVPGSHSDNYWIDFRTASTDVWNWDVWVEPKLRGRGLLGQLLASAEADLEAKGHRRVVNTVATLNRNSIRAFEKAGYESTLRYSFLRVFGWTLIKAGDQWRFGRYTGTNRLELEVPTSN